MGSDDRKKSAGRSTKASQEKGDQMNLEDIKELIGYLEGTGFAEVEVENQGVKVRVTRQSSAPAAAPAPPVVSAPAAAPAPAAQPAPATRETEAVASSGSFDVRIPPENSPGKLIISPIVGTFYAAPAPDKPPYVTTGDAVKKGQVVCIVEAMKLMNEIESEFSGKVAEILVEDGEPVEFGQPLMRIEA